MKKLLDRFIKSSFIRNVFIMATGTAGAQAVTMALSPIITRLYGPEAFGILGTFSALIQIIIPIAALTYPIAIVLPKSDENAKKLIKLSLYITFFISFITALSLLIFNTSIVKVFQIEEIAPFLYLIPLVIIFAGIMQVTEQWLIRTNQFSINAKASFLQSVVTNGSKAGIGLIYPSPSVLVIIQTIGNGVKALIMVMFARNKKYNKNTYVDEKILSLKELAKKYIDFPLYRSPEVFLSSITQNLPVLLLTSLFGPASAGFYSIGRTVLGLPSRLIGQSIGDVFYPRISEAANNGENLNKLIKKATIVLAVIGIIPFGIVILFGPFLFEFVFGKGWNVAGEYARWIALSSYSIFVNKPSVRSMPVLRAQRFQLFFTIITLIVQTVALLLGFFIFNNDLIAVALFGISAAVLNSTLILVTLKRSKNFKG